MTRHLSGLAARRHRITLMREEKSQGAGGRFVTTSPIITDVWAAVSEQGGSLLERGEHEHMPERVRFTVQYRSQYQQARRIGWKGAVYRVSGQQAQSLNALPSLIFDATLTEGNQL